MRRNHPVHYAWIIALTGLAVLFACLGLGRFSLGMLLPSMEVSLNLTYSQMGFIGTGNFIGYMISVFAAGIIARAIGARWTIFGGLVLVGATMVLVSRAATFLQVMSLYVLTGMGSGLANVPMMGLVSHWFMKSNRGRAAGIMLIGNGIAFVFAGLLIPWINASQGAEGWRTGWFSLGIICLLVAAIAGYFLRNNPMEKGLAPLGHAAPAARDAKATPPQKEDNANRWAIVHLGCIYALFGTTYVVYATFIVTSIINERGYGENAAGTFWAIVGALSISSGPLFGWFSDRMGRKTGLMLVFALFTISYALVATNLPGPFLYASIGIFGIAIWSVPTIMAAAVGDYTSPEQAVKAFGFITLFFGVGQISGPAIAGYIADTTGTFSMAFWLCASLTVCALVLSYFLRPPSKD